MKVTLEQIEQALENSGGFVTQAARQLNISHPAVIKRIKRSKRLQEAQRSIKEMYLDLAESKLIKKIKKEDLGAICFFLKCQGKERGYVERQELTGKGGKDLKFRVTRG